MARGWGFGEGVPERDKVFGPDSINAARQVGGERKEFATGGAEAYLEADVVRSMVSRMAKGDTFLAIFYWKEFDTIVTNDVGAADTYVFIGTEAGKVVFHHIGGRGKTDFKIPFGLFVSFVPH